MKVLYLEDNEKLASLTSDSLRKLGLVVEHVGDSESAQACMNGDSYDVYVLDRMVPGPVDGAMLCQQRKQAGDSTPVLLLTALTGTDNRIEGLESGADDYLEKPFDVKELLLRVRNLARRKAPDNSTIITLNKSLSVDLTKKLLYSDDTAITLTPRLWNLLECLVLNKNNMLSKTQLINKVWGMDADVLDNTVEASIRKLRAKLGDKDGVVIETAYGFGYKLNTVS
jgi:two-component system, OmpR family, response regulator